MKGYAEEIERLRKDLLASREKNGVFLHEENYKYAIFSHLVLMYKCVVYWCNDNLVIVLQGNADSVSNSDCYA